MTTAAIRPAGPIDFADILRLNQAVVQWTAPLATARLQQLHDWSVYHRVIMVEDQVAGFLLVMPDHVAYDSPNYRWFQQHHQGFWYVDRIVISPALAGRHLGLRLYADLFHLAKIQGIERITCEYNCVPMNQASAAFHACFGFRQVATQWLDEGRKQVSLQVAEVARYQEHKS
ncbi:GNAT family N-acetyltransferase [Marinicella meishanensis]|uniref:GNAT family N-acetyltransferase n=1 Tax=Marinicella meishanensis TaxID=2873263 RepID=UPI001CBEE4A0|nr:GNAT family N-acetyltransferase [Marinicella sp. NBU2979]